MKSNGRKHTIIIVLDQLAVSGSNFLTGFLLARYLGAEGYGQYILAYGFLLFVSGLQVAIVISPMMVTGPRFETEERKNYFRSLFTLQMLFNFIAGGGIYLLGTKVGEFYPEWNIASIAMPLAVATICFLTQDFFRRYFISSHQSGVAFINDILFHGLRVISLLYVGHFSELNVDIAFKILALSSTIPFIVGFVSIYSSKGYTRKVRNYRDIFVEQWSLGKWLIANNLSYWGSSQLIVYMVAALVSVASVGAMNAALNIVGVTNILYMALENIVPMRATQLYKTHGVKGLNRYLIKVSLVGGGLTSAIVIVACVWAEEWMSLLYDNKFSGYSWIIYGWALCYFIGFFHRPLNAGLKVLNDTKGIFISNMINPLIAMTCGYWAISNYNVLGALSVLCVMNGMIMIMLFLRYRARVKYLKAR